MWPPLGERGVFLGRLRFDSWRRLHGANMNCQHCNSRLVQRPNERGWAFRKRRFCDNSCSKYREPLSIRFWKYVQKTDGCWLWNGGLARGYGMVKDGGRRLQAHRIAFLLTHGYAPANVLHKCDVPACVNPDHLFGGSIADNVADMIAKGRAAWQKVK